MRTISRELIRLERRADPQAQDYIEAIVTTRNTDGTQRAHIRQALAQWAEADGGAAAVDALFTRFDNGDLRLKGTLSTLLTHSPGAISYFTDLDRIHPFTVAMLRWDPALSSDFDLSSVQFYLNPRRDLAQQPEVTRWRLELYGAEAIRANDRSGVRDFLNLFLLAEPVDVLVTGDTAGFVTFSWTNLSARPRPKLVVPRRIKSQFDDSFTRQPFSLAFVYALTGSGAPAANVGLGYLSGMAEVSSGANRVSSRQFVMGGPGQGGPTGWYGDQGPSSGAPYCIVETGSYTAATITFSSANLFDLGGVPTGDVELTGLVALPAGTALTLEVRNDADTGWVPFTNGQFEEADLTLTSGQTRKMRATLTPNAAGNLTPTLKKLGRRELVRTDLSRVARIEGYEQAFEPETHQVEIPRPRLVAVKDGPHDFRSKIENLLAENFINDILIRWWRGASSLSRNQWTHMDDFLVLDTQPSGASITVQLVGLCALLKDLAPPFSSGTSYAPDGDQSVGSWSTDTGAVTNLYQAIDEPIVNVLDYVQSGTSPANQTVIFTLPTPTDLAGRRLFLDCEYSKDASGGEVINLTIQVYQTGSVVAEITKADIGPDRVASTMELSAEQRSKLIDLANVRFGFVANTPSGVGARRARVYWARFRSGGRREVVTYTNATPKFVYDDLIANRLAIPANLRGPGIEITTTTMSKQITGLRKRSPEAKDVIAKSELEAIAFLADQVVGSSEGRIKAFPISGGQPVRAIFPARRIRIGETSPGHARRIPEFFLPYRWDPTAEEFKDEVHAFHTESILRIGTLGLGPPKWLDAEIGKWIDSDSLAETVGRRVVNRLGTGVMLWSWDSMDRYPELEIGDWVGVETDQFVGRDPNLEAEVKGNRWAIGPLQRVGAGTFFTIWLLGYADILCTSEFASRHLPPPGPRTGILGYARFVPSLNAQAWDLAVNGYARPAVATGANQTSHAAFTKSELPQGAQLRNTVMQSYIGNASAGGGTVDAAFYAVPNDGTTALSFGINQNSGASPNVWLRGTNPVTAPHRVDWTVYHYEVRVFLRATGTIDNTRLQWVGVEWE